MAVGRAGTDRGDLTRTAVLALLGTAGPLSRTEIARRLDLSPASVTQLARELLGQGMIEELDRTPSRGGRPAQLLGLVGGAGRALGVKVAADHLVLVDVRLDGEVLGSWSRDFDATGPAALDRLVDAVAEVAGQVTAARPDHGRGPPPPLLGVGVGVPGGVVDQADGVVSAPTLGWSGLPVGTRLRRRLDLPVLVENDVNALAVAERLYGRGRTHRDFLVLTIGWGIGAAIVTGGRVYRGAHGGAGEFGHMPVDPSGPACACGNTGCLEALVGEAGLAATARARGILPAGATVSELARGAAAGDRRAQAVYAEAGEVLGRSTAGLVNIVDPEIVVVLGEGTTGWRFWQPGFDPALRAHLLPARQHLPVEVEAWGDTSWAQGAAALVFATPFDAVGAAGEQGRLVRARLIGVSS